MTKTMSDNFNLVNSKDENGDNADCDDDNGFVDNE